MNQAVVHICAGNNITSFGFTKNAVYIIRPIKDYFAIIALFFFSENTELDDGNDVCAEVDDFTSVYDRKAFCGKVIEVEDTDFYASFLIYVGHLITVQ